MAVRDRRAAYVEQRLAELNAIAAMDGEEALMQLRHLGAALTDSEEDIRIAAAEAVGQLGAVAIGLAPRVASLLRDRSAEVRRAAVDALGVLAQGGAADSVDFAGDVASALNDPAGLVRAAAALALGRMQASSYAAELRDRLEDAEPDVVSSALVAVGLWGADGQELASAVERCLSHPARGVRAVAIGSPPARGVGAVAIGTLLKVGGDLQGPAGKVAELLADQDGAVREAAVSYFEFLGERGASEADRMAQVLESGDGRARAAALMALGCARAQTFAEEVAKHLEDAFEDDIAEAQCAAGAAKALPATLRRPACAAAMALALMGEEGWMYADQVADILDAEQPTEVKATFLHALGLMGSQGLSYDSLAIKMLRHPAGPVRASACFALGEFSLIEEDYDRADAVAGRLEDPLAAVREAAAEALAKMPEEGPRRAEGIFKLLTDRVANVQIAAIKALGAFGDVGQMYASEVCRLVSGDDMDVRLKAIEAVGDMGDRGAALADELAPLLEDPSPYIRAEVLQALAKMGEEAAEYLFVIRSLMDDPAEAVREAAVQCHDALA